MQTIHFGTRTDSPAAGEQKKVITGMDWGTDSVLG